MSMIKVKYNDNEYEYSNGMSILDIVNNFKSDFKSEIIVAMVNNRLMPLDYKLTKDSTLKLFDTTSIFGKKVYDRGLYLIFVKAVKDVLKCDVKIMYEMNNDIYCEILSNNPINDVIVEKIKIRMKNIIEEKLPITKIMVSKLEAMEYFIKVNQKDKASSLRFISNNTISLYKMDDVLDYFYGVMPINSSYINNFGLKYISDNKVALSKPIDYTLEEKIKYNKNDLILKEIGMQSKYLENINITTSVELNKIIAKGEYGSVIRTSETILNKQLFDIADKISSNKSVKLVLLSGPSASGKSITALKLSSYLKANGYEPILLSTYDYKIDDENSDDSDVYVVDSALLNKSISSLLEGNEVELKINKGKEKKKLNDNGIIILEGTVSFADKVTEMIPDKNKFKIFVSTLTPLNVDYHNLFSEKDNRLLRKIVMNNRLNRSTASDTLKKWKNNIEKEEKYIYPYIKQADEIYNTSLVYELGILKTYAEPLLFSVSETDDNYDEALRLINLFRVILGIPSDELPNDSIIREFVGRSCFKSI